FIPAYVNMSAPHGSFSARQLFTFDKYHYGADLGRDVGFAICGRNIAGKTVEEAVGKIDLKFYPSIGDPVQATGYCTNAPWGAERLVRTIADIEMMNQRYLPPTPGIISEMQTSGGPWLVKDATDWKAIGLCSYGYRGK